MRSLVLDYIDEVYHDVLGDREGSVADYIPQLAEADPESFGIALATADGHVYEVGDSRRSFTLQSLSKPFTYALALADHGVEAVGAKVGVEPSGEPFNEISLDPASGHPRNPMINAGAIACAALVRGDTAAARFERIRLFYSRFAGRELSGDEDVKLLLGLRDQLLEHGCEVVLVGSGASFDAPQAESAVEHYLIMSDTGTAIEYCEDMLIARYSAE